MSGWNAEKGNVGAWNAEREQASALPEENGWGDLSVLGDLRLLGKYGGVVAEEFFEDVWSGAIMHDIWCNCSTCTVS